MSEKNLYEEIKRRKMQGLKKDVVKAVQKHGKILAIRGKYEKPEKVIKYVYAAVKDFIRPTEVTKKNLSLYDIVMVGCPGNEIPKSGISKFRDYVLDDGGWLITTDWCLRTIVENAFPGYIHWGGEKTGDVVVPCHMTDQHHPFLDGVYAEITSGKYGKGKKGGPKGPKGYGGKPTFSWWMEDKSFPITVDRPDLVKVLVRSEELGRRWMQDPVLVYFDVGKNGGRVIHMISHTHLQKGKDKGKFISGLIITNIIDEKIGRKHGISSKGSKAPAYTEYGGAPAYQSSLGWSTPQQNTGGATEPEGGYLTPTMGGGTSSNGTPELTGTAKPIELHDKSSIPLTQKCALGDGNFDGFQGQVFKCSGCGAHYHENCLAIQLQDGTCKICGKIFLY